MLIGAVKPCISSSQIFNQNSACFCEIVQTYLAAGLHSQSWVFNFFFLKDVIEVWMCALEFLPKLLV